MVDEPRERTGLLTVLTRDLGLKAIALALAVLLWLVVGARAPAEAYVTLRVEPALHDSLTLLGEPPRVRAFVAGRTADLVKLYTSPPVVRSPIDGDMPRTMELDVTPADVHLQPGLANQVRVLEVEPRRVTLHLARRAPAAPR